MNRTKGISTSVYLTEQILQKLESEMQKLKTTSRSYAIRIILEKYFEGDA